MTLRNKGPGPIKKKKVLPRHQHLKVKMQNKILNAVVYYINWGYVPFSRTNLSWYSLSRLFLT